MTTKNIKFCAGVTLIELMISLAIGSFILLSVFTAFSSQSAMTLKQSGRTLAIEEGREVFYVMTNLLKQAQLASINIISPTDIEFQLLTGAPVWPNDTAPYQNSWVKLRWVTQTGKPNKIITIANAASQPDLAAATQIPLAGDASGLNTKITDMIISNPATGGLLYQLEVESGSKYNPTPQTTLFESTILPRN